MLPTIHVSRYFIPWVKTAKASVASHVMACHLAAHVFAQLFVRTGPLLAAATAGTSVDKLGSTGVHGGITEGKITDIGGDRDGNLSVLDPSVSGGWNLMPYRLRYVLYASISAD